MKNISILLFMAMATLLISASCQPNGSANNGNGKDSVAVGDTATLPTGGIKPPVPVEDTTTLPTGGIKPLPVDPKVVQQKLHDQYLAGEIDKCRYEGVVVYKCSRNAPDAGSEIYASNGDRIARCYYSTRQVDAACEKLTDCETIYRIAKNIWGKPEVKWAGDN